MTSKFLGEGTEPRTLASMAGLGYVGFLLGGPIGAAAGTYLGYLAGRPAGPAAVALAHMRKVVAERARKNKMPAVPKVKLIAVNELEVGHDVALRVDIVGGPSAGYLMTVVDGEVVKVTELTLD